MIFTYSEVETKWVFYFDNGRFVSENEGTTVRDFSKDILFFISVAEDFEFYFKIKTNFSGEGY